MKKVLSLFLACLMILSSFGVTGLAAEEGGSVLDDLLAPINFNAVIVPSDNSKFNGFKFASPNGNPAYSGTLSAGNSYGYTEVPELISSGVINKADLFGFTVEELYKKTTGIDWLKIQKSTLDDAGMPVLLNDYSSFTLARAYTNKYLTRAFTNRFGKQGSMDLFTLSNFITITNFIGRVIDPYYVDLTPSSVDVPYKSEKDFYNSVVEKSGLREAMENNWCNSRTLNYRAILDVLGFDYEDEDMLGESKIYNATRVSRTLVRSVITRIIQQGPVDYLLGVMGKMIPYYSAYAAPVKALFNSQIVAGRIKSSELESFEGLLNLFLNRNNPEDTTKLQIFNLPVEKIKTAVNVDVVDKTNLFMIMLLYFNLTGKWTTGSRVCTYFNGTSTVTRTVAVNNPDAVNRIINSSSDEGVKSICKALFKADFAGWLSLITDESVKHMEEVKNPGPAAGGFVKSFFETILKYIADIFAKIYNSFKNFGDF